MNIHKRLTQVYNSSRIIHFDDQSRFILFSDCHRGDNTWADDFANNQSLFFHALEYYFSHGYTYIEVGDGDELWENTNFMEIRQAHSHIFWMLQRFFKEDRLFMIYGNHDIERSDPQVVANTLHYYYDERSNEFRPLLKDIQIYEGLVMHHRPSGGRIFLVHGHQGDQTNDQWWKFGRWAVRHIWRHLQLLGIPDPTSPAKNFYKRIKVEQQLSTWAAANPCIIISGHTHRPRLPKPGESRYFNTGSCVHPRCITGIEIEDGEIRLVKWWVTTHNGGLLHVTREEIVAPQPLLAYFVD